MIFCKCLQTRTFTLTRLQTLEIQVPAVYIISLHHLHALHEKSHITVVSTAVILYLLQWLASGQNILSHHFIIFVH